jgi:hypothetical protein
MSNHCGERIHCQEIGQSESGIAQNYEDDEMPAQFTEPKMMEAYNKETGSVCDGRGESAAGAPVLPDERREHLPDDEYRQY